MLFIITEFVHVCGQHGLWNELSVIVMTFIQIVIVIPVVIVLPVL